MIFITGNYSELDISEDIFVIIMAICVAIVHTAFALKTEEWKKFLHSLVQFNQNKRPNKFFEIIKSDSTYTKIYVAYTFFGCTLYGLIDYNQINKCFKTKENYHLDQLLCGMFTPLWLPFSLHNTFVPFLYLIQYIFGNLALLCGLTGLSLIWQSTRIIVLHIDILNNEFNYIFKNGNNVNSHQIRKWVQHHNHITE